MSEGQPRERWGSKLGVILAVAGSAVGLGNFLRFPGLAAENGGGAFMIPYFTALLLLGIPICWVEWTMGRRGGRYGFNSSPGIFGVLWRNPISKYFGAIGLLIPVVIYMYYVYIESWCLAYAFYYLTGSMESFGRNPYAYTQFFAQTTGTEADGITFKGQIQPIFWFFLFTFVVNFIVIFRGLSKGIETFCKVAMPILILAGIVVAIRVMTLPEQPVPAPWHQSLSAAIPEARWNALRDQLADPALVDTAKARSLLDAEFNNYFAALVSGEAGYDPNAEIAPPAGFLSSPKGFAISLAELRAGEPGEQFRHWVTSIGSTLSGEQKRQLQRLERRQMRLEKRQEKMTETDFAAEREEIETARKAILASATAETMPSLESEAVALGVESAQVRAAQERAAATEAAEQPRTVLNGLGYMWNPDFDELSHADVWLQAAGQIFFTLSVGFGVILNYASYLRRKDDVVLSGLTASATNEFCEVCLGGLVAIPATFIFLGTAVTLDVISAQSSFSLGFNTLPTVFANMPAGRWFAATWFFLLFLAGITSSLSMLQPAIAFLEEGMGMKRRASVAWLGLLTLGGAMAVVYFSKGLRVLDTMDFWVGQLMLYVLATIEVILFAWVLGIHEGFKEAHLGAQMRIPSIFKFIIKYVTPAYLLVILVTWFYQEGPARIMGIGDDPAVLMTMIGIGGFFAFLLVLIYVADQDWKKQGCGLREIEE